jgi:hypothetical protein
MLLIVHMEQMATELQQVERCKRIGQAPLLPSKPVSIAKAFELQSLTALSKPRNDHKLYQFEKRERKYGLVYELIGLVPE